MQWPDEHLLITAHEDNHAHLLIKVQCKSTTYVQSISTQPVLAEWDANFVRKHLIAVLIYVDTTKDCPLKDQEREMSETESQTMDSEDNASATSTRGSEIKCDNNGQWDGNWGRRKGSLDAHGRRSNAKA